MKKALIENGIVINIVEVAALPTIHEGTPEDEAAAIIARHTWTPPDGAIAVDATGASIGDAWDGSRFVPPAPPPAAIPQTVSRQQMMSALMLAGLITEVEWLACYQLGTLPELVSAAIDTLPDAASKLVAKVKWVEFSEARRTDPMVALLAAQANMTAAQIDDLFRTAAAL